MKNQGNKRGPEQEASSLRQVKTSLRNSSGLQSSGPLGGAGVRLRRAKRTTHAMFFTSPWVASFALLLALQLLLSMDPFSAFNHQNRSPIAKEDASISVWATKNSGLYYCRGGMFGKGPGERMTQGLALDLGYRPAEGGYCTDNNSSQWSLDASVQALFSSASATLTQVHIPYSSFLRRAYRSQAETQLYLKQL